MPKYVPMDKLEYKGALTATVVKSRFLSIAGRIDPNGYVTDQRKMRTDLHRLERLIMSDFSTLIPELKKTLAETPDNSYKTELF